jgi:hypothetical protein
MQRDKLCDTVVKLCISMRRSRPQRCPTLCCQLAASSGSYTSVPLSTRVVCIRICELLRNTSWRYISVGYACHSHESQRCSSDRHNYACMITYTSRLPKDSRDVHGDLRPDSQQSYDQCPEFSTFSVPGLSSSL